LRAANNFVHHLVKEIISRGGGLILGVGGEVLGSGGEPCVFDWTALEVLASTPDPAPEWPSLRRERFIVVASQRALEKVPEARARIWQGCRTRADFDLSLAPAGWRMGGIIRERQVLLGDVLVVLGGGAGAEHLAELYRSEGKPVIPISADLGSINNDGRGGSVALHELALNDPRKFFVLRDGTGSAAARLTSLLLNSTCDVQRLACETANLVADLRPPGAFYVRLLAKENADFPAVERFFREVVDVVVKDCGFTCHEMGRDRPSSAFMNVEIFEALHRSGLVVVDLTGVRANCMMELGYALGRRRRVVLSAQEGTILPFDQDKLPTYLWEIKGIPAEQIAAYRDWLLRNIDLPPLVE